MRPAFHLRTIRRASFTVQTRSGLLRMSPGTGTSKDAGLLAPDHPPEQCPPLAGSTAFRLLVPPAICTPAQKAIAWLQGRAQCCNSCFCKSMHMHGRLAGLQHGCTLQCRCSLFDDITLEMSWSALLKSHQATIHTAGRQDIMHSACKCASCRSELQAARRQTRRNPTDAGLGRSVSLQQSQPHLHELAL